MRRFMRNSNSHLQPFFALALVGAILATGCAPSAGVIDWVDFIKFSGITYLAAHREADRPLKESDLGPEHARVKFKLTGNVHDLNYRSGDGDAAFLEPDTPVHTVKGYAPKFRLAARRDARLILYEADTNPNAQRGADLLDIGDKVRYIGVNSEQDGITELAAIKDSEQVATLVDMVLQAPVDQDRRDHAGPRYFIAFHLRDGTAVTRAYWLESGELSRGIMLPDTFRTAVEQALQGRGKPEPLPIGTPALTLTPPYSACARVTTADSMR